MKFEEINKHADSLLQAVNQTKNKVTTQSNRKNLDTVITLVNRIKNNDLEARHELKGLFIAKSNNSDATSDVSFMEVHIDGLARPLQWYIDQLIEAVENYLGYRII